MRPGGRPAAARTRAASTLLLGVLALGGCTLSLPLGGTGIGRAAPLGDRMVEAGMSGGLMPELMGTLPDVGSNPIPHPDSLTTSAGGIDLLGFTIGLTESVDVGINFSRGLHSMVRVAGGDAWSVSISPAVYRFTGTMPPGVDSRLWNLNVTTLLAAHTPRESVFGASVYAGASLNRYSASIGKGTQRVGHSALAPSALGGVRLEAPRCLGFCGPGGSRYFSLGAEVHAAWIRQRSARLDLVPTMRLYMTVGGRLRSGGRTRR